VNVHCAALLLSKGVSFCFGGSTSGCWGSFMMPWGESLFSCMGCNQRWIEIRLVVAVVPDFIDAVSSSGGGVSCSSDGSMIVTPFLSFFLSGTSWSSSVRTLKGERS